MFRPLRAHQSATLRFLWAKKDRDAGLSWHPLILHMLDVAAAADRVLDREPESTRRRIAAILGLPWDEARPWILLLIACHDLGKAYPAFQRDREDLVARLGVQLPRDPNERAHHGFVSQCALRAILVDQFGWPRQLAYLCADAVGCHHGERASSAARGAAAKVINSKHAGAAQDWVSIRAGIVGVLHEVFEAGAPPTKATLNGTDFHLLAGLTSFADWIGSNEAFFPFAEDVDACDHLRAWFKKRKENGDCALTAISWEVRSPLVVSNLTLDAVSSHRPRPLHMAIAEVLRSVNKASVLVVEAPMGEGKTEAAFYAFLDLQRRLGHRGLYVALPTRATGNAMFTRVLDLLRRMGSNRRLDLQLLHGARSLNKEFDALRRADMGDKHTDGANVRAAEWFTHKKRALLSEYGVGTIDQALMTILPVRHSFVRLWGLANRVVIIDELHAYSPYTEKLALHLIHWLHALGSSVIVLSATLSPSLRRRLANAVGARAPASDVEYPRISVLTRGEAVLQRSFATDAARRRTIALRGIPTDPSAVLEAMAEGLPGQGSGLVLVNTVGRAQEIYRRLPEGRAIEEGGVRIGKRLPDGTTVLLFHGRYPASWRQAREDAVLRLFGPKANREGRVFLIATQVAEQSLDIDFDVMITDLATIDVLLQRLGRLWRHERERPGIAGPVAYIAGLDGAEPPRWQGKPLFWDYVYRQDLLLATWHLLRARSGGAVTLPDDIDVLVEALDEIAFDPSDDWANAAGKAGNLVGEDIAERIQADMAIIGLPDDGWDDPNRYVLHDEDSPALHRTLMAQTRLGDSVVAIPLWPSDAFDPSRVPSDAEDADWFLRGISISRGQIIQALRKQGVPDGWQRSTLLRNCYPLHLDVDGRWHAVPMVRLDSDLGLVYDTESKE